MEHSRFDNLARAFAARRSRRGVLGGIAGIAAGLLVHAGAGAATTCPLDQVRGAGNRCLCRTTGRVPGQNGCPCPRGGCVMTVDVPANASGGVATGVVLGAGQSATIMATDGSIPAECAPGCGAFGPNGYSQTAPGDFLAPGLPEFALVGQVGNGPWMFVGSGPTTLSGPGEIRLAFNDNISYYGDNIGSFTATITYS